MSDLVKRIVEIVRREGGQTFAVGGAVRDKLLNTNTLPKDYDVMVRGVPMERLKAILPGRVELVGQSFGVLKVMADGETIDVALPRTEVSVGMGHGDFDIHSDPNLPVEDDLARRDFTMNAIAVDLVTNQVIDPFGGTDDIRRYVIRAVRDPHIRFTEDPLRMLRACRFVSKLGFEIDLATASAMVQCAPTITTVTMERVWQELDGILVGPYPNLGMLAMTTCGLMQHLVPEFMEGVLFDQRNAHHDKTVVDHVLAALAYGASRKASRRAMWAIWLHDIAKPRTFTVDQDGQGHFYGHEDEGGAMAITIMNRLKCPMSLTCDVAHIIAQHLNPPHNAGKKSLRRFVARMGELTEDALACREADLAAHAPPWPAQAQAAIQGFRLQIAELDTIRGFTAAQLAVHGGEIIEKFQVRGAAIGILKEAATQAVIDGVIENDHDAVIEWLRAEASAILDKGG